MSTTMTDRPTTAPALADGATTAARPMLSMMESLALGFTLTALRPEWDTPENRARLTHWGATWHFPHAQDFAHVMRAAVWYASHTVTEEFADEDNPVGSPAYRSPVLFPHAGPWWTATAPATGA